MPIKLPQDLKSIHHQNLQPEKISSKMRVMIMMDISGAKGNDIAQAVGMTPSRVSIIRNSPIFIQERDKMMNDLRHQVVEKKSTEIVEGDPVERKLKELAVSAVDEYEKLLVDGKSEMVRKATADAVLDRAGYKAQTEKKTTVIEMSEKMAQRFEKVIGYEESGHRTDVREAKITIKEEVSS